jgi:hypothetical protein
MSKFISAVVDEFNPDWVNVTIESNFDEDWVFSFPYKVVDGVISLNTMEAYTIDDYEEYFDDIDEFREGVDGCETINDVFTSHFDEISKAILFKKERDAFVLEVAPSIIDSMSPKDISGDFRIYEFTHEAYPKVNLMFAHNVKTNEYFIVNPT